MPSAGARHKILRTLFILIPAALILASCSSPKPEPSPSPVLPSASPEEGQTITLITPDASNIDSSKTSKYQIQTRLTDFELMSGTEGLAWGVTRNSLRLYMTRDNGKTWSNISPSSTVQFSSNPVYGKDIFFTDPSNGWIIRQSFGMMETVVLRTRDGGATWKVSSLNQGSDIRSIYFVSALKGWLLATWDSEDEHESKALYKTEDGGATWKTVMQNDQYMPNSPHPALPVAGETGGLVFRDFNHGLNILNRSDGPELYHSFDGGAGWRKDTSFSSDIKKLTDYDKINAGTPHFFSFNNGWIPVSAGKKGQDGTFWGGYFTADGGSSWKYVSFNLGIQTGTNADIPPTFLNNTTGWRLIGNLLYRTDDQGKVWKALSTSSVLKSKLAEYPEIVKLQFIDEETGWLLIEKSEDKRSILLQTTDGGLSWHVM
ncbi:Ycf48-like protein [compost metagenome]